MSSFILSDAVNKADAIVLGEIAGPWAAASGTPPEHAPPDDSPGQGGNQPLRVTDVLKGDNVPRNIAIEMYRVNTAQG